MMARPISDEEREELTAFLDGEADPAARARVEARLNSDPAVRAEADALKKVWELLDTLPMPEPSPTFTSKTLDRLGAIRPMASTSQTMPLGLNQRAASRVPWPWIVIGLGGLIAGWIIAGFIGPKSPPVLKIDDPQLVRDLRLIENLPLYTAVESMDYLHALDKTNRFDSDSVGP
jgi:anti-sigma factor RsiW